MSNKFLPPQHVRQRWNWHTPNCPKPCHGLLLQYGWWQEACGLELPPMIQSHSGLYGSVKHAHTSSWHLQTPLPARYHHNNDPELFNICFKKICRRTCTMEENRSERKNKEEEEEEEEEETEQEEQEDNEKQKPVSVLLQYSYKFLPH